METLGRRSILFIVALRLASLTAVTAHAEWQFSGDRLVDDFNGEVFPGWQPDLTTEKPGFPGDAFLGASTNVELFLMDFGSDFSGRRLVDISFASINPDSGVNQVEPLRVTINGDEYTSEMRSDSPARFGIAVSTTEINLDLFYDPQLDCCRDLQVAFSHAASEPFGLDNVVVDWSQVPEPSSIVLAAIGTFLLSFRCRNSGRNASSLEISDRDRLRESMLLPLRAGDRDL